MWESHPTQIQSQCLPIPGRDVESEGITKYCDLTEDDQEVFDKYKNAIDKKIRSEKDLHFPDDFEFVPSSAARQCASSHNCYFRINLPRSIITVKIIPNAHITDLSEHISLRRESVVNRDDSVNELVL